MLRVARYNGKCKRTGKRINAETSIVTRGRNGWELVADMGANPYLPELIEAERRGFARNLYELQGALNECVDTARAYPHADTCGACGGAAYRKPSVGCYKCVNCNAIEVNRGEWVDGAPQRVNGR